MTVHPSAVDDALEVIDPQLTLESAVRTAPVRRAHPPRAVLVSVHASLDDVRCLLLGIGATSQHPRSTTLDLGDHLLVLGDDEHAGTTTVAIRGANAFSAGRWLAEQVEDRGWRVDEVLPPIRGGSSGLALNAAVPDPVLLDEYRRTQETEAERSA